jgi:uncharacterized membrane protein
MSGAQDAVTATQRAARRAAIGAWFGLAALCVLWEVWLAPLRPGGSWLVLKALPLLLAAPGVARGSVVAFQWATLLVLLYVAEAAVRVFEPLPHAALAGLELALAAAFFAAAIVYLRPFKLAARARRAERAG